MGFVAYYVLTRYEKWRPFLGAPFNRKSLWHNTLGRQDSNLQLPD
jgi:hypothetical protein